MRTNSTQFPTYKELQEILAFEAQREIPREKENVHYADFSTIIKLLRAFNLSTDFFTENLKFRDLANKTLFNEITGVFESLKNNILSTQKDSRIRKLFDDVYNYLSREDSLNKSDLIFVFGAKQTFRIEKAVCLYKQGYAPKILVSGKSPYYEKTVTKSEAEKFAEFAIKHGVPQEDIILEKESITIPDNVKRSLNLLENKSVKHDKIILVNSPFSQRRGWAHFNKMSKIGTTILRTNSDKVSDIFTKNSWYKNEIGTKIIVKEFFNLRIGELLNTV